MRLRCEPGGEFPCPSWGKCVSPAAGCKTDQIAQSPPVSPVAPASSSSPARQKDGNRGYILETHRSSLKSVVPTLSHFSDCLCRAENKLGMCQTSDRETELQLCKVCRFTNCNSFMIYIQMFCKTHRAFQSCIRLINHIQYTCKHIIFN